VPRYETVPGWKNSVRKARGVASLPPAFRDYVRRIEDLVETKVAIVSTGVEREDTILLRTELEKIVDCGDLEDGSLR